jgi:tetratricopeptide (TPR) repeat protein
MGKRISLGHRRTRLACFLIAGIAGCWPLAALAFDPETDHVCRLYCNGGDDNGGTTRRGPSGEGWATERYNHSVDLTNEATDLGRQGRWQEAIALYRQAIATDPSNLTAKAQLYGIQGRIAHEQCYNLYHQHSYRAALAKCEEARQFYEPALQLWPGHGWAASGANYDNLMKFIPSLSARAAKEDLDETGKLVVSLLAQGREAEAKRAAEDFMRRNPGAAEEATGPMDDYAHWMLQHKRYAESESAYREALDWQRSHSGPAGEIAGLHAMIGIGRRDSGDLAGALAEFQEALRAMPNIGWMHTFAADVYLRQGNVAAARTEIEQARSLGDQSSFTEGVEKRLASAGSARSQLPTVNRNSVQAERSPGAEAAKQKGGCGFDTMGPGCSTAPASEAVPAFRKTDSDPPAVAALKFMIPAAAWAKHDPQIDQSVAWFAKLESEKSDKQDQLRALEQKIAQGEGDKAVLAAQKKTLEIGLARIGHYQARAKATIEKALKHYDLSWNEASPSDAPASGGAAPGNAGEPARPVQQDKLTPEDWRMINKL